MHLPFTLRRPFLPARERVTLPVGGVGRLGGSGSSAPVVGSCCGGTRRGRVAVAAVMSGSGSIAARPLEPRGAAVEARGILAQARQVREGRHGWGDE